jgi:hypothetical protein
VWLSQVDTPFVSKEVIPSSLFTQIVSENRTDDIIRVKRADVIVFTEQPLWSFTLCALVQIAFKATTAAICQAAPFAEP